MIEIRKRFAESRRAFTLVEVLIVVGIIGVLAAILIPAISAVRMRAYETKSTSNMRQIHAAILLESNLSNGRFPAMKNYPWDGPVDPGDSAQAAGYPYMQEKLAPYMGEPTSEDGVQDIFRNPVIVYRGKPEWLLEPEHTHYRYNVQTAPGRQPRNDTEAILLFDVVWPDWPSSDLPYKHDGESAIKVVYVSGAVELMTYSEYTDLSGGSENTQSEFFARGWTEY